MKDRLLNDQLPDADDTDLRRILLQIDHLKREWLKLPEDVRRSNPSLAQFFNEIVTKH